MKFLSQTSKHHFRWLVHRKIKFHNQRRRKALEQQGYEFWDIQKFEKIRNFEDHSHFEWTQEKNVMLLHNKNNDKLKTTNIKKNVTNRNKKRRQCTLSPKKYGSNKKRKLSDNC